MVALREPSLGPVFPESKAVLPVADMRRLYPMEDINLHFTGDFHAIGAANNLLAALIDNHIYQGNELNIDPRKIVWKRCVDMNDRQLRFVTDGLGGRINGVPREDGYDITVASEIMAVLCLSKDITDLKKDLAASLLVIHMERFLSKTSNRSRPSRRRSYVRTVKRCFEAEPCSDTGAHSGDYSRWTICKYRTRL